MTDRELLELAAKAASKDIDHARYDEDDGFAIRHMAKWWNPIANDGDALRLAVKLRINVAHDPADEGEGHYAEYIDIELDMECSLVVHGDDPFAATRRAIVEAAAEIGKAMP